MLTSSRKNNNRWFVIPWITCVLVGSTAQIERQITDGLRVYFPFDGDATDAVGGDNNGTLERDPTFEEGKFGHAIQTGSAYVSYRLPGGEAGDFTVAAHLYMDTLPNDIARSWFNLGTPIVGGGVFMNGRVFDYPTGTGTYPLGVDGDGGFLDGSPAYLMGPNFKDCEQTWCHVALVNDSAAGVMTLYLNGTDTGSTIATSGTAINATDSMGKIGSNDNQTANNGWPGRIDEFGLWTRALSSGKIAQISNSVIGDSEIPPTQFTWHTDNSGNWNDGGNWSFGGPPGANYHAAIFGDVTSTPRIVFTETDITVRSIQFDHDVAYGIAGISSIYLESGSVGEGVNASVQVHQGTHQFLAPVQLNSLTEVRVSDLGELIFNHRLDLNGQTLMKTGRGTMSIRNDLVMEVVYWTCKRERYPEMGRSLLM